MVYGRCGKADFQAHAHSARASQNPGEVEFRLDCGIGESPKPSWNILFIPAGEAEQLVLHVEP
jgi:hypothetical protein